MGALTVKAGLKNMPELAKGSKSSDMRLRQLDGMLAVKWREKKEVSLITTVHTGKMKHSGKRDHETKEK